MTHTNTKQEQAEFEAWKEDYALTFEPNYNEHLEADCKAAFLAGMQAARRAPAALDVTALVKALERVKLTDHEVDYYAPHESAYWNNAVTACISAVISAHRKGEES